ncbi:MAG: FAD:protein FMN transferase [Candidatus Hydrogenedentes bacterium]|nr:FAD:protein FMN transferase [Candidatus Hydrogenedentota bacterium]
MSPRAVSRVFRPTLFGVGFVFLLAGALPACQREPGKAIEEIQSVTIEGPTMGTRFTVKIERARDEATIDAASRRIPEVLGAIDSMMSTYKPDSELSRFNQHQDTSSFPVSPEMIEVFQAARVVSEASGGAFDITVGPIVNAWGFGPEQRSAPPADSEINALLPRVGYLMVEIDAASSSLRKARPDIYCDLSGIAQGYAADRVAKMLDELGVADYMIDVSGEFRTRGRNDRGDSWQIAVERPDAPERTAHLVVPLSDKSLATSGDYRNYRERDGKRVSHEIDPKTGQPIAHGLASVTVVTDNCALADAYATALIVMGPEKGFALASEKGMAVFFLVRNADGGFDERRTPQFDALVNVVQ